MTTCPECDGSVALGSGIVKSEILRCPDCGAELEVTCIDPLTLAMAPQEEEDWGE
ncbi:MAG: lysine biosynthesis protein LysW [Acidobacteria bacterium]|nr:lysine biosynthesis protein LysW [Acidobacteriota bacterium]